MDNQSYSKADFKSHVVQISETAKPKSITFYAIGSLLEVLNKYGLTTLDAEGVRVWIATMLMKGMTLNSVKRYVGRVHTIYNDWNGKHGVSPFDDITSLLEPSLQMADDDALYNFDLLKRLMGNNVTTSERKWLDIFLFLLYNADMTLSDVAEATFDTDRTFCAQVDEIVKTCDSSNGRKYLFNLKQSQVRPTQIQKEMTVGLTSVMKKAGLRMSDGTVRDIITSIWIVAAMKCGIDICDIRAIIPSVPPRFRALSLITKREITEAHKRDVICRVADIINDNTPRWFVMKLRKGIGVSDVREKIENQLPGRLQTMELYYPTRVSSKRVGKKIVKQETPYLPDMIFFRTPYNRVRSLFAVIGDIAWCYKVSSSNVDSRYSIISNDEMANFQRCLGQFTNDIRIEISNTQYTLDKGRMVRITGGLMKGYKGIIEELNDERGTRKFFLRISNDNTLSWTAEVDAAFIEPLP